MTDKDVVELQNIFTTAAQIAKSKDKINYVLKMDEDTLIGYLKQAFPKLKDKDKITYLAKTILNAD